MKLPSPAMFVSVAALVVALGGTSYAAVSINGKDIKKKSITSSQIKKNSLGGGVIKDGKLGTKDLAPEVIKSIGSGKTRWLLVGADGAIKAQSGGFSIVAAYPTLAVTATDATGLRANGNVYINAGEDLADNGIVASVVLQNTVNQDGGGTAGRDFVSDANAEFSGEITVSRCNVGAPTTPPSGPTNCAPAGAQNATSFVVSPRLSDGQATGGADGTAQNRKAFYVIVSGS